MRIIVIALLSMALGLVSGPIFAVIQGKTNHLFYIERSKNRNLVQYDVLLMKNEDLPDSRPVTAYWVLENGRQEELTSLERKYAYGIDSQEKLDKNKFRVLLAALKEREIVVEKIGSSFKAVVSINGTESILEKVYIESKERLKILPKILYVELFGRAKDTDLPVKERIRPN